MADRTRRNHLSQKRSSMSGNTMQIQDSMWRVYVKIFRSARRTFLPCLKGDGKTFINYLTEYRMEQALDLLLNQDEKHM